MEKEKREENLENFLNICSDRYEDFFFLIQSNLNNGPSNSILNNHRVTIMPVEVNILSTLMRSNYKKHAFFLIM
jgi:hypothetical protein